MVDRDNVRDLAIFGLGPDAVWPDVLRAYERRRTLYSGKESFATYGLYRDYERREMLAEVEAAFERLSASEIALAGRPTRESTAPVEEIGEAPTGSPPDPESAPGEYLRYHRLKLGLNLHQVAGEIKVGAAYLGRIESEDFLGLPAAVYVRGFVASYAEVLGLPDAEALTVCFLEKMQEAT